jgi:hypothetical protein
MELEFKIKFYYNLLMSESLKKNISRDQKDQTAYMQNLKTFFYYPAFLTIKFYKYVNHKHKINGRCLLFYKLYKRTLIVLLYSKTT